LPPRPSRCGDAEIVIAGGQENMSASPHVLPGSRDGFRMGDRPSWSTAWSHDGLCGRLRHQYHMGVTAENIAKKYGISREEQDALRAGQPAEGRCRAGRRALHATRSCRWSIPQKKGDPVVFDADEYINLQDRRRGTGRPQARPSTRRAR
jgi:acetyl-CoA C-acetyltransferase